MPLTTVVIEDSSNAQEALKDLFETLGGFRLVAVLVSETEATEWILEHRAGWQLAVIDLMLADGSGFNLIPRFSAANPEGHVVILSEFATSGVRSRCLDLGATAVFRKSEAEQFLAYVEALSGPKGA